MSVETVEHRPQVHGAPKSITIDYVKRAEETNVAAALQFATTPTKIVAVRCVMKEDNMTRFDVCLPLDYPAQKFAEEVTVNYRYHHGTGSWCTWGGNAAQIYIPGNVEYMYPKVTKE